jgi:SAM-dependent methyltransferase
MTGEPTDQEQELQERQYEFPYHYLPRVDDDGFTQLAYWSWGLHYLGGMQVVLDHLPDGSFDSLVDVGCGDGRFLREVTAERPDLRALGVDYSERSIGMARGMNPDLDYEVRDIVERPLGEEFDVATCIEVLEHVPPEDCEAFVAGIRDALVPGGRLVLTVPHANKPVNEKHYRHFTADDLESLLAPRFDSLEFVPFDRRSKLLSGLELLLGGRGRHFVVNSPPITGALWRLYRRRYLYAPDERRCRRLAVVCE